MSEFISSTFGKISGRHGTAVAMKSKKLIFVFTVYHPIPKPPNR